MLFKHGTLISGIALSVLLLSCKKNKDDKNANEEIQVTDEAVEQTIAGSYAAVTERIGQINIVGSVTTPLRAKDKSFKLADLQADAWDDAIWSTTEVFNCFGPCDVAGHSNTPAQFVTQAIDSDRQASPMKAVQDSVSTLCLLSQIFDNTGGLPPAGTKTVTFNAELRQDIAAACPAQDIGENDFDATVTVTDVTGTMFDKKIDFAVAGQSSNTVYLRNNGKFVNIGSIEGSDTGVRRTILSYNQETFLFRFELIGMDTPGDISKSLNFYRGFIDENTSEMRFTAMMGSNFKVADRWQNLSFLAISGQFGQNEIGATISRQDDQKAFENKFVCFKAENIAFVSNSACDEDPANDRKAAWSYTSQLAIDIAVKAPADWKLTENTALADFDGTTIASLAPIYQ